MEHKKITFGSLFTGIGGIDLGLERAGMECKWQVEIDEFCLKVLNKHWPDVPKYKDVYDVGKENLETVDLIAGGFPCQPVSEAGKEGGEKDERWLWPEFYRIICELRPKWVLVENVRRLLSIQNGKLFGGILRDLAQGRYNAEWQMLPAEAYNAPHQRERIFIIAYTSQERWGAGSMFDREHEIPSYQDWNIAKNIFDWAGWERWISENVHNGKWEEPATKILGMDDGLSNGMERVALTGNAVVPQVAEHIGRMIMEPNK